jgi:glutathione S-transferase
MLELFQAEWCPHSAQVRGRLTELGVPFVARQVPADQEARAGLRELTGSDEIPVLVLEDGRAIAGEDAILAHLDRRYSDRPDAARHREKAVEQSDQAIGAGSGPD